MMNGGNMVIKNLCRSMLVLGMPLVACAAGNGSSVRPITRAEAQRLADTYHERITAEFTRPSEVGITPEHEASRTQAVAHRQQASSQRDGQCVDPSIQKVALDRMQEDALVGHGSHNDTLRQVQERSRADLQEFHAQEKHDSVALARDSMRRVHDKRDMALYAADAENSHDAIGKRQWQVIVPCEQLPTDTTVASVDTCYAPTVCSPVSTKKSWWRRSLSSCKRYGLRSFKCMCVNPGTTLFALAGLYAVYRGLRYWYQSELKNLQEVHDKMKKRRKKHSKKKKLQAGALAKHARTRVGRGL
jgi:hypothetical protein